MVYSITLKHDGYSQNSNNFLRFLALFEAKCCEFTGKLVLFKIVRNVHNLRDISAYCTNDVEGREDDVVVRCCFEVVNRFLWNSG